MKITDPIAELPRRELIEYTLTHGNRLLSIITRSEVGKPRRDGSRRRVSQTVQYLLERRGDSVELVKDCGEVYQVTRYNCTCDDHKYRGRSFVCKHRSCLLELGLLT